jgi:hypothetical protein
VLNLPAANILLNGLLRFLLVRTDNTANAVTVNCAGADTFVDGSAAAGIASIFKTLELFADGVSKWYRGSQPDLGLRHEVINGAFDWWQAIETAATTVANGVSTYGPDQWYAKNSLGTNGVLTIQQVAAALDGSGFGCQTQIAVAPTAAQANGCELYYILGATHSRSFYNKLASLAVRVKGLGNVNQVGIQFFYATSEVKLSTAIGAEVLLAVSGAGFSFGRIIGQALGTAMTAAGVVGFRIRIMGVSAGNLYDLNNGYVVEQAQMAHGSVALGQFARHDAPPAELLLVQRYYQKTYAQGVTIGGNTGVGAVQMVAVATSIYQDVRTKVEMRATPTRTLFSANAGGSGAFADVSAGGNIAAIVGTLGPSGGDIDAVATATITHVYRAHVVDDARI